jgi:hypothetical protein
MQYSQNWYHGIIYGKKGEKKDVKFKRQSTNKTNKKI